MKKFQVLAGIVSTVAISGGIAFSDPASAYNCPFGKSQAPRSGSGPTPVGPGGSDQMNPWKSYKASALGFLGLAGVLGGGAAYMSYRAGKRAEAACAAMSDNFEVFEETVEPIADAGVSEYVEVPLEVNAVANEVVESSAPVADAAAAVAVVREHPESPGGYLDFARC